MSHHILTTNYNSIRGRLSTGDVVLFDGRGFVSRLVRMFAGIPSHSAMVCKTHDDGRVQLIESTSQWIGRNWVIGVQFTYLSERLKNYKGRVWVAPLTAENKQKVKDDPKILEDYLIEMYGKSYDFWQVFRKGWSLVSLPRLFPLKENYNRLFCSELVAGYFKRAGILPSSVNASTVTPRELAQFRLYGPILLQLCGKRTDLPGFNTVKPQENHYDCCAR